MNEQPENLEHQAAAPPAERWYFVELAADGHSAPAPAEIFVKANSSAAARQTACGKLGLRWNAVDSKPHSDRELTCKPCEPPTVDKLTRGGHYSEEQAREMLEA